MKKVFVVLCLVFLVFILVSCNNETIIDDNNNQSNNDSPKNNGYLVNLYCNNSLIKQVNCDSGTQLNVSDYDNYLRTETPYSFFSPWCFDSNLTNKATSFTVNSNTNLYCNGVNTDELFFKYVAKSNSINISDSSNIFNTYGNIHLNSISNNIYSDIYYDNGFRIEINLRLTNVLYGTFGCFTTQDLYDSSTNTIINAGTLVCQGEFYYTYSIWQPSTFSNGSISITINSSNFSIVTYLGNAGINSTTIENLVNSCFLNCIPSLNSMLTKLGYRQLKS